MRTGATHYQFYDEVSIWEYAQENKASVNIVLPVEIFSYA